MIDQHSYGPYYSLPFGRPSLPSNVMPALDQQFYDYIASAMGTYNGMRAGNSPQARRSGWWREGLDAEREYWNRQQKQSIWKD